MLADFRSAPTPTLRRLALSLLAIAVSLLGQEGPAPEAPADPEPTSRAEAIEQARREKAKNLTKPVSGKIEKVMHKVEDTNYVERLAAGLGGLRGRFGGLATGQGFALGPGYTFRTGDGDLKVSTFAGRVGEEGVSVRTPGRSSQYCRGKVPHSSFRHTQQLPGNGLLRPRTGFPAGG